MKLPANIHFKIFDLSFPGTNRYRPIEGKVNALEAAENRKLLKKNANAQDFFALEQVHGTEIHYADHERPLGYELSGDGSYTDKSGMLLHIGTADCVPVMFFANDGSIIGAAHAGWKGARGNIMKLIYEKLAKKTSNISAIIGPSISQESYEVDADFYKDFMSENENNAKFFIDSAKQNHKMFDIRNYVKHKLTALELSDIYEINEDTYSKKQEDGEYKYPSYRRFCHGSGEMYPRVLSSTIMIKY
jgi:hypothetical protein